MALYAKNTNHGKICKLQLCIARILNKGHASNTINSGPRTLYMNVIDFDTLFL